MPQVSGQSRRVLSHESLRVAFGAPVTVVETGAIRPLDGDFCDDHLPAALLAVRPDLAGYPDHDDVNDHGGRHYHQYSPTIVIPIPSQTGHQGNHRRE